MRRVWSRAPREHHVDSVEAVARRSPVVGAGHPYDVAQWHEIDVGSPQAVADLVSVFRSADAVVALAWLLQPNRQPGLLHQTNVSGNRNIIAAARDAGVPHLVYASSLGTYAPHPEPDVPVDERWPATGVPGSLYSQQKAAVEAMLDATDARGMTITRMRPALVFQRAAASEIARYFIGPLAPLSLLRWRRVPVGPFPAVLRFQCVHADDVAAAVLAALRRRVGGAFNLAAGPVLTGPLVAETLRGRHVDASLRLLAEAADLTWKVHLQPTSPGWLRMGLAVPLMDSRRAAEELDWAPTHDTSACRRPTTGSTAGYSPSSPTSASDHRSPARLWCQAGTRTPREAL
ncbi:MAG: NAD-dependent epimerase/dehydratase family protein [Streptosporangiales bacterium]